MADISLTASMRSNLLSLQQTQSLMDMTQERLSTGKKVNSAIDNPSSYYAAQSLTNRASDLSALLDSMGQAIQTIQAADEGIETITEFAQQAKAIANQARDDAAKYGSAKMEYEIDAEDGVANAGKITVSITKGETTENVEINIAKNSTEADVKAAITEKLDGKDVKATFENGTISFTASNGATATVASTVTEIEVAEDAEGNDIDTTEPVINETRQKLAAQFNSILDQIDQVAKDANYKGVNLLQSNDLKVIFNEDRSSKLTVKGHDASSAGLKIATAANDWKSDADVETSIKAVEEAVNTLRSMSSELGNNYSIVQSRETFTENMINVLEEGADKLTLADMNEESANMLALQTRQQLAINSLSLASQAAQSVLKLF